MGKQTSSSPRVERHKKARREAGFKEVRSLWAHPEDIPKIRLYARKLFNERKADDKA